MYVWIKSMGHRPSILSGLMTYYDFDQNIHSYRILLKPNTEEKTKPEEIEETQMVKKYEQIYQLFKLSYPNKIYNTRGIVDLETLCNEIEKLKEKSEKGTKAKLIYKIRRFNDTELTDDFLNEITTDLTQLAKIIKERQANNL